jgi:cytochrome c-type biogenesis protein CcmH
MLRLIILSAVIVCSFQAQAIVNGHEYPFEGGTKIENANRAQLFRTLAEELRCPKCQNQNLADSNAMISSDLRRELYNQVKAGKQGDDIIEFMVNRYGEFVLYKPTMNFRTIALWYGPVFLLSIAILVFSFVLFKRRKKSTQVVNDDDLDTQESLRIDELLKGSNKVVGRSQQAPEEK